uniref:(northern house mosquito) hypothetical protein n=1 Tax=Culex pipiens TaxID=7175 RepID=A0A8D8A714_CULPI
MKSLSFFPIVGGIYAFLQIVGSISFGWSLIVALVEEPAKLEAFLLVQDIAYLVAHILLAVGILRTNVKCVKAFKLYFVMFLVQLLVLFIIVMLDEPNRLEYLWFTSEMLYHLLVATPVLLLTLWITYGVQHYVEQKCPAKAATVDDLDSNYDKQVFV